MRRTLAIAGLAILGLGMTAELAYADPPCGRGWRRGEYCGPRDHQRRDGDRRDAYRRDGARYGYTQPRAYAPPPPAVYAPNYGPSFSLNVR